MVVFFLPTSPVITRLTLVLVILQPVLVMRFEASSEELLAAYRNEMESWLRERGIDLG